MHRLLTAASPVQPQLDKRTEGGASYVLGDAGTHSVCITFNLLALGNSWHGAWGTLPAVQPAQPEKVPHNPKGPRDRRTVLGLGPATYQDTWGMELGGFASPGLPRKHSWKSPAKRQESRSLGLNCS